jgi:HPt (histidine-containing phosphotransfer) domain-containing protein
MSEIQDSHKKEEEAPFLDKEGSLWRLGGDQELYEELVTVFMEEIPDFLKRIKSFFENQDYSSLEQESHALKGSASAVGAVLVSDSASKLEIAARNNEDSKAIILLINNIEIHVNKAEKYLKKNN